MKNWKMSFNADKCMVRSVTQKSSLAGQPLKNIKGLVKRPIQFGDAVFVVLRISKLRANL